MLCSNLRLVCAMVVVAVLHNIYGGSRFRPNGKEFTCLRLFVLIPA